MTRNYYQILEIDKNATAEQIKKSYRKLSLKWHPDRHNNKSLEERKKANEKMGEINQAYEVLGNEELKRRYDNGETNFTSRDDYNYKEELRRRREEINKDLEEVDDRLKKIKKILKELAREETIEIIRGEMSIKGVRRKHLDNNLFVPYSIWEEKVLNIEVGDDDNSKDGIDIGGLDRFKEMMIKAIRDKKIQLDEEKMKKASSDLERTKIREIGTIEKELESKNLKAEDLDEEYRNYEEEINNLTKIFKVRSFVDKVVRHIRSKGEKRFESKKGFDWKNQGQLGEKSPLEPTKQNRMTEPADKKEFQIDDYDNLTKEELISEIKKNKLDNEDLKQLVQQLEKIISTLEKEIQELKQENDNSSEYQIYLNKKEQELKNKQLKSEQLKGIVRGNNFEKKPEAYTKFPTGLVVGGGAVLVVGLVAVLFISKKGKKTNIKISK